MYNVIVIGAGHIGALFDEPEHNTRRTHASGFHFDQRFNLLGFVDENEAALFCASKIWHCKAYKAIGHIKENVDVIIIASSDKSHYQLFKESIALKPQLIVVEKPVSLSLEDTKHMIELAESEDVKVLVNFTRRFFSNYKYIKKLIKNMELGEFLLGNATYGKGILHNGSHLIDLLLYFFDEIKIVDVSKGIIDYDGDVTLTCRLACNQSIVNINGVDSNLFTIFEQELLFEKGRIRFLDSGKTILVETIHESTEYKGFKYLHQSRELTNDFSFTMAYFVDYIYDYLNDRAPNISDLENALKGQKICMSLKELYDENTVVL